MSKLSTLKHDKDLIITSHDKKVCDCGRIITRAQDQANGICRLCNPFNVIEEMWDSYDIEKAKRIQDGVEYTRVVRDNPFG